MPHTTSSRISGLRVAAFASLVACWSCVQAQTTWKPDKTVEVVVYSAPGGGNDKSARAMDKIWKETNLANAVVLNKVGGGGSLAYTYVSRKTGDAHFIAIAQAGLVTNQITGLSPIHYTDLTPLSFVGSEPAALAVRADSPYKSLQEFLDQLRKDPASLSISVGSTRGATNHIVTALLAKAGGIDAKQLKILVFDGGALSMTNLLGGHIDAVLMAVNNSIPHHKSGTVRILGLSALQRSTNLPDVPTFRERGYQVMLEGWTVFVGPKGLVPTQVAFWEGVLEKSVYHEDWKKYLVQNAWQWGYKNSRDTLVYLNEYYEQSKALLTEIGMAKQ